MTENISIGMGGGAASSMYQGENKEDLDFGAVQRGDAEMEQKVRVEEYNSTLLFSK